MAKRSALGKGLGAFFGDDVVRETENKHTNEDKNYKEDTKPHHSADTQTEEMKESDPSGQEKHLPPEKKDDKHDVSRETFIKITEIEPNQEQPRKNFDEDSLHELADSMKEYGVLQPLLVKKNGDTYQIIAGERRWRAAKLAGMKEVPVIIREYDRQQSVEIALIENVQRSDLNPVEEAMAYQQLIQEFGLKQEEIASRVCKSRTAITNAIRLLKLPASVQNLLVCGEISSGHARALLSLNDAGQQEELAKKIAEKGLSVRETERIVKAMLKPQKKKDGDEDREERDLSFIFRDLEERMKGIMGTKVMIHQKDKNKGRIEIEYYSESELERIVELIESIR